MPNDPHRHPQRQLHNEAHIDRIRFQYVRSHLSHGMTEREFGLMKQDSYLINSARSYLVDTQAFKNAMDSGKLLGAAIDVFETEPDIPEFYRTYDNITLTNHLGGITINSFRDAPGYAMKNYLGYLRGESELMFWVNKNKLS